MRPQVIVIAGVAGCGKTTVGEMLALGLGRDFADADDYHSDEHKARMKDGTGLTDEDRMPWLGRLAGLIREVVAGGRPMVLACSALSRAHRDALRVGPGVEIFLIHVPEEEIIRRLRGRTGHFFNPALVRSQFVALEMPADEERTTVIDGNRPPEEIVENIRCRLDQDGPPSGTP
jgi:gluconokinase